MGHLKDVVSDERERLIDLIKFYEKKIRKLPKGSIRYRIISNNKYAYNNYRENEKHFSVYVGKADSKEVKKLIVKIEERKKLNLLLKKAKDNFKEVARVKI